MTFTETCPALITTLEDFAAAALPVTQLRLSSNVYSGGVRGCSAGQLPENTTASHINRRELMGNAKSRAEFMTGRTSHLDKHKPIPTGRQSATGQTLCLRRESVSYPLPSSLFLFSKKPGSATFSCVVTRHVSFYCGHSTFISSRLFCRSSWTQVITKKKKI